MHHTVPCEHSPLRPGLTLVEVMVALVLLAVGLLGIAGASAVSLRAVVAHSASLRASRTAAMRMAMLEAAGCASAHDGTSDEAAAGQHERWHVAPMRAGMVTVDETISWEGQGRERSISIRGALLC